MNLDDEELKVTKGKTADEMFRELGYKKITKNFYNYLEYVKVENEEIKLVISFEGTSKTFMCALYQFKETKSRGLATTMQELKAINKKCEELGWLDE